MANQPDEDEYQEISTSQLRRERRLTYKMEAMKALLLSDVVVKSVVSNEFPEQSKMLALVCGHIADEMMKEDKRSELNEKHN